MTRIRIALPLVALLCAAAPATAQPVQQQNSSAVWFLNWGALSDALLRVQTPSDTLVEVRAAQGTPVFQLGQGGVLDGVYSYELYAMQRDPLDPEAGEPFYTTGRFVVIDGVIVPEDMLSGEPG